MKTAHTMPTACFTRIAPFMLMVATMLGMCSANAAVLSVSGQPTPPTHHSITTITSATTTLPTTTTTHIASTPSQPSTSAWPLVHATAPIIGSAAAAKHRRDSVQAEFVEAELLKDVSKDRYGQSLGLDSPIYGAAFSPNNGNVLVTCAHMTCIVYNSAAVGDYKRVQIFNHLNRVGWEWTGARHTGTIYIATLSDNGNVLVTCAIDNSCIVYKAAKVRDDGTMIGPTLTTSGEECSSSPWMSKNPKTCRTCEQYTSRLYISNFCCNVRLQCAADGCEASSYYFKACEAECTPCIGSDGEGDYEIVQVFGGMSFNTRAAVFSPNNGNVLVTCRGGKDPACIVYSTATVDDYNIVQVLKDHTQTVGAAAFSPKDGNVLVTCSDRSCIVYNTATVGAYKMVQTLKDPTGRAQVKHATFSPNNGNVLVICSGVGSGASAGAGALCTMYNAATAGDYKKVQVLEDHTSYRDIKAATFSPTGNVLVTCSRDNSCIVYDAATVGDYRKVQVLKDYTSNIETATFSPKDGNVLVVCFSDGSCIVYKMTCPEESFLEGIMCSSCPTNTVQSTADSTTCVATTSTTTSTTSTSSTSTVTTTTVTTSTSSTATVTTTTATFTTTTTTTVVVAFEFRYRPGNIYGDSARLRYISTDKMRSALEKYLDDARMLGLERLGKLSSHTIDRLYYIPDPTFNGLTILKLWVKTSDAASLNKLLGVDGKELSNDQKQEGYVRGWGALNLKIAGEPDLDLCPLDLNNKNKSYFVCDSGDQCLPVEDLCNLQQFTPYYTTKHTPYCVDGSDVTKSANCKITTTATTTNEDFDLYPGSMCRTPGNGFGTYTTSKGVDKDACEKKCRALPACTGFEIYRDILRDIYSKLECHIHTDALGRQQTSGSKRDAYDCYIVRLKSTTSATTTSSTTTTVYSDDDWRGSWYDDDDDDDDDDNWNYAHTNSMSPVDETDWLGSRLWRERSGTTLVICLVFGGFILVPCCVYMYNYKTQMTQRQYAQQFETAMAVPEPIGFINPTFEPGGYGTDDGADTADDDDDFVDGSYSFRNDAAIPGASKSAMQNPTYEEFSVPQDDDDSDDEEV